MAKTYEPIATTTLGSATASYTFSSIPSTYTDLVLVTTAGNSNGSNTDIRLQFNGSSTGYSDTIVRGNGTATTSTRETSQTSVLAGWSDTTLISNTIVSIQNYSNATTYKSTLSRTNNVPTSYVAAVVGLWQNTAAITSLTVLSGIGNFIIGSTFTLYGIKAA
jgi:hypothetical protein